MHLDMLGFIFAHLTLNFQDFSSNYEYHIKRNKSRQGE